MGACKEGRRSVGKITNMLHLLSSAEYELANGRSWAEGIREKPTDVLRENIVELHFKDGSWSVNDQYGAHGFTEEMLGSEACT